MQRLCGIVMGLALAACQGISLSPDELMFQANRRLDAGDTAGAVQLYDEVLDQVPDHALALNNRGLAHAAAGNLDAALTDYDRCLSLPSPPLEAWYNRGVARLRAGGAKAAVPDFTRALEADPRYLKAWAGRGLALAKAGDKAAAALDLKKALQLAPPDWPDRTALEAELARLNPKP